MVMIMMMMTLATKNKMKTTITMIVTVTGMMMVMMIPFMSHIQSTWVFVVDTLFISLSSLVKFRLDFSFVWFLSCPVDCRVTVCYVVPCLKQHQLKVIFSDVVK